LSTKDDRWNSSLFFTTSQMTSGMPHLAELKEICPHSWELFVAKYPDLSKEMEKTYAHIKLPAKEAEGP
jgi:hypothetical protein